VDGSAERLTAALDAASRMAGADGPLSEQTLTDAVAGMRRVYDPEWGGFGRAPKFPPASAIEFLLRAHRRGIGGALEMATGTLDAMAAGGMYDVLAGGFARYSVDGQWLVPHFEKMLYDNALLASAYLHGHAVTGDPGYRWVAEATLDFLLTDMLLPEGGFASALDADTLGEEGAREGLLGAAMQAIADESSGVVVVLRRDMPLSHMMRARAGEKVPEMNELREYGVGAQILAELGIHDMILLTNSHHTLIALDGYGLNVVAERPIPETH